LFICYQSVELREMVVTLQQVDAPLANYIFLGRHVRLPLSALKVINQHHEFSEIIGYSESQFKALVDSLGRDSRVHIREKERLILDFIQKRTPDTFKTIKQMLDICDQHGIKCISYFSDDFPGALKQVSNPPKFIFIKGDVTPADTRAIAMVGTREPTPHGAEMAKKIARRFVELGFTIVSGLARGIDAISMRAALDHGGRVIGSLGCGILNIYPKENAGLADDVSRNGALLSEVFPEDSVNARALQMRNRITSGFGLANVIVEGRKNSGTKWQIKFGKEQGKPAIAVKPIDETVEQASVPLSIIRSHSGYIIDCIEDVDAIADKLLHPKKELQQTRLGV
jgi:DNA protecting protein DprA